MRSGDLIDQPAYDRSGGYLGRECPVPECLGYFKVTPGVPCSTTGNTQDRRELSFLNPAFKDQIGRLAEIVNGGTQNYHGMLLQLNHRPTRGLNVNANYTWSHCIGDYMGRSNSGYGSSVDHTYQDPNNRRKDRADCEVDARHAFNLTGVAETPQFANRTVNLIGTGWRLSGIYRITTGALNGANASSGVRTVTLGAASAGQRDNVAGGDRCLCDISNQRPNLLLPNAVYLDTSGRPGTQWLNPAAFAVPKTNIGRYPTAPVGNVVGPGTQTLSMSLAKSVRLKEALRFQIGAQAANILNHVNYAPPNMTFGTAPFGTISNVQTADGAGPRQIQITSRLTF